MNYFGKIELLFHNLKNLSSLQPKSQMPAAYELCVAMRLLSQFCFLLNSQYLWSLMIPFLYHLFLSHIVFHYLQN